MKTILVIEDDASYSQIISQELQLEGFDVLTASNGREAIDIVSNQDVDLILLDLVMPEMDGPTFFYKLKNDLQKDTPVVILSNQTSTIYPDGVKEFILKPNASLEEIVKSIRKHLNMEEITILKSR